MLRLLLAGVRRFRLLGRRCIIMALRLSASRVLLRLAAGEEAIHHRRVGTARARGLMIMVDLRACQSGQVLGALLGAADTILQRGGAAVVLGHRGLLGSRGSQQVAHLLRRPQRLPEALQ